MRNNDFEFDAVKNKWSEKGYLLKNTQGRLFHNTKCYGMKAIYIKLSLSDSQQLFTEDPPF
jgi:hypothetical protein